ncbi:MAG TPA: nuclear transport factor 2 family protein [Candidatus Acidoferrales bacterium]|nr:nuclear transport factor 2 family protein [Candidatus Acidoferrales bacterium]
MSRCTDLVRDLIRCYDAMDADALEPLLHPQAKHTAPGSDFGADIEGASPIAGYFRKNVFPAFHAVRFEIVNLYEDAEQSAVIVEWRSHLKPKTGKNYSNTGVFVIEVKDGKIYWVREYFDTEKAHQNV